MCAADPRREAAGLGAALEHNLQALDENMRMDMYGNIIKVKVLFALWHTRTKW